MHRRLFVSLALVGPLTVVLLTASPAGALSVPTASLPPAPVLPVALPSPSLPALPHLPPPSLPALPQLPPSTSPAVTLPAVTLPAPQLPLSDVTDTIADLVAPLAPPVTPTVATPAALGLPPAVSTPVHAAAADVGASTPGSGAALPAQATAGGPASAGTPTPGIPRPRVDAPARRDGARQGLRPDPRVSRSRTRGGFFGWFGVFMPFTGRDILEMVRLAVVVLCVGFASMVAARLPRSA
jgi:hypothetical protein